jgi:microcystin-dependent protein
MSGFYRSETGTYWFDSNLNTNGNFNTLSPYEIGNLTNTTEPLQGAINALRTKTDTTNINLATTTTNANDALQRTQEISFSDDPTPQTNITAKCVLEEVVFTTDLNDITPTTFSYLQGVTSSIQNQLNSKIDSVQGTIIQHVSANLQTIFPSRFLLCNGQNVSRTTYNVLFSIIGTTYGSGDGSTTFGIPDYRACFLRMYSDARTVNGVVYTPNVPNTIQQDSLEAHVHSSNVSGNYLRSGTTLQSGYFPGSSKPNQSDCPSFTGGVSSSHRTSSETRCLNHSVYFYITC